jgi:hypothetical protein
MKAASVNSDFNYPFVNSFRTIGHEDVLIFEVHVVPTWCSKWSNFNQCEPRFRHDTNTHASFDVIFGAKD